MVYIEAFARVLPIILLILLGAVLQRTGFIELVAVGFLRKLSTHIALPAVLFLAFSGVTLEGRHLVVAGAVFALCVLALAAGRFIGPLVGVRSAYFPAMITGFEAGAMGYAMFGAVYGTTEVFKFAVIDLGQVIFVFFVLAPWLQRQAAGPVSLRRTLVSFFTTAPILAIFAGIVANRLGIMAPLEASPIGASLVRTLELLAGLLTPLICLIIGSEVQLRRGKLSWPTRTVAVRYLLWAVVALAFYGLVVRQVLGPDLLVRAAVFTMFMLPPPFVAPLFMGGATVEDREYVVNTLSLATLVTLGAFTAVTIVAPP